MSYSTSIVAVAKSLARSSFLLACFLFLPNLFAQARGLAGGEYFIGLDPGPGNGTPLPANDGAYDTAAELVQSAISVLSLSNGVNRVGLRFSDSQGLWGNAGFLDVMVQDAAALVADPPLMGPGGSAAQLINLSSAEYFVDTDPGSGNAISLAPQDGAFDTVAETALPQSFSAASLSAGPRRVGLRFRDSMGRWGNSAFLDVRVEDSAGLVIDPPLISQGGGASPLRILAGAEYSLDGGIGLALAASDGAFDSTLEQTIAAGMAAASLSSGAHRIAIRFQDAQARWGNETFVDIAVQDAGGLVVDPPLIGPGGGAPPLRILTAAEYSLDGGPGVALAAGDGVFDAVVEQTMTAAVSAATFSTGVHQAAVRFQDSQGRWGNQAYLDVRVDVAGALAIDPPLLGTNGSAAVFSSLAAAEFFLDEDPGAGNGAAMLAADNNFGGVAELLQAATADVSQLAGGPHRVGLRFKDSAGEWGTAAYQGVSVFSGGTEAPSIAVQPPARQIVAPDEQAIFSVLADGFEPLRFQWLKEGVGISAATNSFYSIPSVATNNAGGYVVIVANNYGSVTSRVSKLIVRGPTYAPEFVTHPVSQIVLLGATNLTLSAVVDASWPVYFQWFKDGVALPTETSTSLIFTNAQLEDSGIYWLLATNDFGAATSAPARLTVDALMAFVDSAPLVGTNIFEGEVLIRLATAFTNGTIFYTLNGDDPDFGAVAYSGPFTVRQSCVLRAAAYDATFTEVDEMVPVGIVIVPLLTLSAGTAGGGTVTLDPPGGAYRRGTAVTVSATPASGWTFMGWMGDSQSIAPSLVFTMTNNRSLNAVFGTSVNPLVSGNGVVLFDPQVSLYPYGATVRVTAVPAPGNYFVVWGSAGSGTNNPLNFIVKNPNPTVTCFFAALPAGQFALTVFPQGFGRVTTSLRGNRFGNGQLVVLTAAPDPGQLFLGWSGDAAGTNNPLAVMMNSSKIIEAAFTSQPVLQPDSENATSVLDGFRLTLQSEFGSHAAITYSSNLLDWMPLLRITNNFGTIRLLDPFSINAPWRFYRAVLE